MKTLLAIYLIVITILVESAPSGRCPTRNSLYVQFLQDTINAHQFYMCDHGKPVLFYCPAELVFNPLINVTFSSDQTVKDN